MNLINCFCQYLKNNMANIRLIPLDHVTWHYLSQCGMKFMNALINFQLSSYMTIKGQHDIHECAHKFIHDALYSRIYISNYIVNFEFWMKSLHFHQILWLIWHCSWFQWVVSRNIDPLLKYKMSIVNLQYYHFPLCNISLILFIFINFISIIKRLK